MIPVLRGVRLVRRAHVVELIVLLVVGDASFLQRLDEVLDPVAIARIQAVSAELAKLAIRHLLSLLDLLRVQLHLGRVDRVRADVDVVDLAVRWLHIRIIIVVLDGLGSDVLVAGLPVLLSNPALELVDGALFKLLAHEFLLAEPRILGLTVLGHVHGAAVDRVRVQRRLRIVLGRLGVAGLLRVRRRHIEHHVVEIVVGLARRVHSRITAFTGIIVAAAGLGLLGDYIDELVLLHGHVLLDESNDSLAQADLVVETGRADDRLRLRAALGHLDRALLLVQLRVELANLNAVDALLASVLQDDQLVRNNTLCDLLLLGRIQLVRFRHLVDQVLATVLLFGGMVQNGRGAHFLLAARVLIAGAKRARETRFNTCRLLMNVAVTHFGDVIEDIAPVAFEHVQIRPYLPVNLAPRYSICFSDEGYELFEVPALVNDVLSANLTVAVNVALCFRAMHDLALAHGEELVAVSALVQIICFFLEEQLKLLHKEARHQLVFALFELVQTVQRHLACHISDDLRVDAAHVHLDAGNFLDVLDEELKALLDEAVDLEEVGRNQNGDRVLDVQLWPVILLDGRLLGVDAIVTALLQSDLQA